MIHMCVLVTLCTGHLAPVGVTVLPFKGLTSEATGGRAGSDSEFARRSSDEHAPPGTHLEPPANFASAWQSRSGLAWLGQFGRWLHETPGRNLLRICMIVESARVASAGRRHR